MFLASFHNNDVTLSQFSVMVTLLQSFIQSLTVVLPFYPVGTMERVIKEDDGAAKRFSAMFKGLDYEIVTCGKTRDGDKRVVIIQDGDAKGKNILIVDDLVQTGGTLYECGLALQSVGANSVSCFVAHGVFPKESWRRFLKSGDRGCFEKFYLTNSIPTITDTLPTDDVFVVLDLQDRIVHDLDRYS
eukprot:gene17630-23207_t